MSDTKKKLKKGRPSGRGNPYGICMCVQCKGGRIGRKDSLVEKIKHKFRNCWKTNKQFKKGAYTD